jgi:hypothetical protein
MQVGPSPQALLVGVARPLAAGAAAVAAGALLRFALRRAVRAAAGSAARPSSAGGQASLPTAPSTTEIVEVFWYRRIVRS